MLLTKIFSLNCSKTKNIYIIKRYLDLQNGKVAQRIGTATLSYLRGIESVIYNWNNNKSNNSSLYICAQFTFINI